MLLEKETIYTEDIESILGPSAQSKKAAAEKKADTSVNITDGAGLHPTEPVIAPATENEIKETDK